MKKLIKLLAIAAILSYAGFFGRKYRLIPPPASDFIAFAGELKDSFSEFIQKFGFGEA